MMYENHVQYLVIFFHKSMTIGQPFVCLWVLEIQL